MNIETRQWLRMYRKAILTVLAVQALSAICTVGCNILNNQDIMWNDLMISNIVIIVVSHFTIWSAYLLNKILTSK